MQTRNHGATILALLTVATCSVTVGAQDSANPFANDPLARALQQDNVYVGKTLRSKVDSNGLQGLTQNAPPDRPLKIGFVGTLPQSGAQFGDRNGYTRALHGYLHLGRGTLLIRTDSGVSAATDALSGEQITQVLQQNVNALRDDTLAGVQQTVAALEAAVATNTSPATTAPSPPDNSVPQAPSSDDASTSPPDNGAAGQAAPLAAEAPPPPRETIRDYWWVPVVVIVGVIVFWFGRRGKAQNSGRAGE